MTGKFEISDKVMPQLLEGLSNDIVDIGNLSVRVSARYVIARWDIHIDSMKIPDLSVKKMND